MRTFRIVFMGTPDFAVPSLDAAVAGPDTVIAAVTQPDRPKGRGRRVQAPPVKERAEALGIPVLQPERVRGERGADFRAALRDLAPDLVVVAAFGQILPKEVLETAPLGCVNVHASLLPRWRGAAPIQRAIAEGDAETGISIMHLDEGMDTGPVGLRRALPIGPEDTGGSVHDRLAVLGAECLTEALDLLREDRLRWEPQDDARATKAPMLKREEGELDFSLPAAQLERRVRAFHPWPGTFTRLDGRLLKVHRAVLGEGRGAPGTVLAAGPEGLEVACGEGALRLLEVQPEGRRRMTVEALLSGSSVALGTVLGR